MDKKIRFTLYAVLSGVLLGAFQFELLPPQVFILSALLLAVAGCILSYHPFKAWFIVLNAVILNVLFVSASVLVFWQYPNLGVPIKVLFSLLHVFLVYAVLLVNNIFLVVYEGRQQIPLYRAAMSWLQIVLVIGFMLLNSGSPVLGINPMLANCFYAVIVVYFTFYFLWTACFDEELNTVKVGERIALSLLAGYLIFMLSTALTFLPTEAFLKAVFLASSFSSILGFTYGHLKNTLDRKTVFEYAFLSGLFLIIVLVFKG